MSIRITLPDDQAMDTVRAHFVDEDDTRQVMTALRSATGQAATPTIAFSRLWRLANNDLSTDADLLAALRQDRKLAADFNAVLQKISWSHLPQVAAASSGEELRLRETDLCAIRIEPSRAEPDQVYVIIDLKDPAATAPVSLITSAADGALESMALPAARHRVIQSLLQRDDALLLALQGHGTEVYLR